MSLGLTHFAVGAAGTAILLAILAPQVRYRGTIIVLGGVWALLPDVGKLYDHGLIHGFHRSPFADLFWFHRTIDAIDTTHSVWWATGAVLVLVVAMVVSDRRDEGGIRLNSDARPSTDGQAEQSRWPDR